MKKKSILSLVLLSLASAVNGNDVNEINESDVGSWGIFFCTKDIDLLSKESDDSDNKGRGFKDGITINKSVNGKNHRFARHCFLARAKISDYLTEDGRIKLDNIYTFGYGSDAGLSSTEVAQEKDIPGRVISCSRVYKGSNARAIFDIVEDEFDNFKSNLAYDTINNNCCTAAKEVSENVNSRYNLDLMSNINNDNHIKIVNGNKIVIRTIYLSDDLKQYKVIDDIDDSTTTYKEGRLELKNTYQNFAKVLDDKDSESYRDLKREVLEQTSKAGHTPHLDMGHIDFKGFNFGGMGIEWKIPIATSLGVGSLISSSILSSCYGYYKKQDDNFAIKKDL
ncbi:hypothetical protein [Cysteiniphilum sp. 6C5]|uniref:hypothetical protein n=1 Tax=Cysteiniphilum TaxID=2056696 RepID=UPI003F865C20